MRTVMALLLSIFLVTGSVGSLRAQGADLYAAADDHFHHHHLGVMVGGMTPLSETHGRHGHGHGYGRV